MPIRHITNGVHVPTWLAPQMSRLYDRHLGPGGRASSGEPEIWEGIENVDDGELWETHLSLKSRLLQFVRMRAMEQAEYRGEPPKVSGLGTSAQPGCVDDRICAALRDLQTRQLDLWRYRKTGHPW